MHPLKSLIDTGEKIATAASWVSGALLLATAALIAIEVVLRKAFALSIGGADELSGYAMAISCSWAFAFALYRKAHIRIDVVYMRLSRSMQLFLDIVSLTLFAVFITVLSFFGAQVLFTTLAKHSTSNTSLHTPLWIPQSLWLLGLLLFAAVILLLLSGTIASIRDERLSAVRNVSAIATLDEEIEQGNAASTKVMAELAGGMQ